MREPESSLRREPVIWNRSRQHTAFPNLLELFVHAVEQNAAPFDNKGRTVATLLANEIGTPKQFVVDPKDIQRRQTPIQPDRELVSSALSDQGTNVSSELTNVARDLSCHILLFAVALRSITV